MIRTKKIIGIFDMDTATMGGATRELLRSAEKSGRMINIGEDIPKSFILTEDGDIYASQISTPALIGRANAIFDGDER